MVTKAQFDSDPYQRREVVTPELDWLGDELCRRTSRPRVAAGTKGDYKHLRGGHRSNDFIRNSPLCTSRTYTYQSGLTAEQERHIAGFDFTPGEWGSPSNRALMRAQTARLRAAMLDGRLLGVREVIGTLDGKTVSGTRYDGERLSSDDSHLDHWHLTFDRRRCRDKALMERVISVALGEDDDMPTADEIATAVVKRMGNVFNRVEATIAMRDPIAMGAGPATEPNKLAQTLTALIAAVDALPENVLDKIGAAGQTPEQIAAILRPVLGARAAAVGELLVQG